MRAIPITPWFQRKFPQLSKEFFPGLLERLAGTPVRIREKLADLPAPVLMHKPEEGWSILENLGHLTDLEPLWFGRIDDIRNDQRYLRSADLTNQKTHTANHNSQGLEKLLQAFEAHRSRLIEKLEGLEIADLDKRARHPRLDTPMTIVDLLFFVAEHDDHHLATCSMLIAQGS